MNISKYCAPRVAHQPSCGPHTAPLAQRHLTTVSCAYGTSKARPGVNSRASRLSSGSCSSGLGLSERKVGRCDVLFPSVLFLFHRPSRNITSTNPFCSCHASTCTQLGELKFTSSLRFGETDRTFPASHAHCSRLIRHGSLLFPKLPCCFKFVSRLRLSGVHHTEGENFSQTFSSKETCSVPAGLDLLLDSNRSLSSAGHCC